MMLLKSALLAFTNTLLLSNKVNAIKSAAWVDDLIEELPEYGRTKTPHFSGYLDGSDGCDAETNGPLCKIHYWFALAEVNNATAPVVLWLNGGPGEVLL